MLRTSLALALLFTAGAVQAQALDGRLKRIAASKTVKIAYRTDATPFSFHNDKQEVVGFTIDLCRYVVDSLASQLKLKELKIVWVPVTVQTRFDAVAKGRADMECGSSTVTLERMKQVDFSSYTFVESTGLLVKSAGGAGSFADLAGKRIAVIAGTTNERAINAQLKRRQISATVVPVKSGAEGMAALESDKVEAYASDKLLLVGVGEQSKDAKSLQLLPDSLSFEPYVIALPHGDTAMRLAVNTGLARLYGSGDIGGIFHRWFSPFGPMTEVMLTVYYLGAIPE